MSTPNPAPLFRRPLTVAELDALHVGTTVAHLGIEFVEVGPDRLVARMPVDARTKQPAGILHGGASVVLAETLGSCAASRSGSTSMRTTSARSPRAGSPATAARSTSDARRTSGRSSCATTRGG